MSRLAPVLLALLLAAGPAIAKKPPPPVAPPPPEGVHLKQGEGVTRLDAVLSGRLRGYAAPRRADGTRDLVLLVGAAWPPAVKAPAKGGADAGAACDGNDPFEAARTAPCRLLRLDLSGNGAIELLRDDLPAEAGGLDSLDVDGDGAEELLVFLPGEIRVVRDADGKRWGRGPEPLIADSAIGPGPAAPRSFRPEDRAPRLLLPIATTEGLRAYGPLEEGGSASSRSRRCHFPRRSTGAGSLSRPPRWSRSEPEALARRCSRRAETGKGTRNCAPSASGRC